MRFMKKLLIVWLSFIVFFLILLVILQTITGYDYSSAYMAVTSVGGVELIITGLIRVAESRAEKALKKAQGVSENIEIVE